MSSTAAGVMSSIYSDSKFLTGTGIIGTIVYQSAKV